MGGDFPAASAKAGLRNAASERPPTVAELVLIKLRLE
jgi:hypothetical protein